MLSYIRYSLLLKIKNEKKVTFNYDTLPKFYFEIILDAEDSVEQFAKDNQIHIIRVEEIEE